jgi:hypothetical protein
MVPQVPASKGLQKMPTARAVLLPEAQSVKLVVSHKGGGSSGIPHGADQVHRLPGFTPAIDVVPEKHDLPATARIAERTDVFLVAQLFKQGPQFATMAVNVTDKVYHRSTIEYNKKSYIFTVADGRDINPAIADT